MPVSDIIRRTKSMRLRGLGLDSKNDDRRTAPTIIFEKGKMVEKESGEVQAPRALDNPIVHDESPYLNRPSEEFFTNLIAYPEESRQDPNPSLPASPEDTGSPESFIGIALGNPEVDPQFINKPEARQGYFSNATSSLSSSTTLHLGLAVDEERAGTATPKEGKWASFTGRFGTKNLDMASPISYPVGQTSPASPWPHYSNQLESLASGRQNAPIGTTHHHRDPQDSASPVSYPRPMEQQPRIGLSKKPSLIKRTMSWRRNPSRKSRALMESNHESESSQSWPLSPLAPHTELSETQNSTMKQGVPRSNLAEASLLHIEIPHIEMERYSVMFSNLLPAAEQPSLLNRRQGPLAKIKLATKTRTQLLQSATLLPPTPPTTAPPTPPTSSPMPLSPIRPAGRTLAANTSVEEISLPRHPVRSDKPVQPNVGCSDSAGPPDLLMMLHHSPSTPMDKRISSKYFFSARPSRTPGPSPCPQAAFISSLSPTSSPIAVLPSRSSSLPTTPRSPPSRTNLQYSALEEESSAAGPTAISTSKFPAKTEISIARQISISRRQQRQMVVPIISRRTE